MDEKAQQTTQPITQPSLMSKLRATFRPSTQPVFTNDTRANRGLNLLSQYHAIIFLALGVVVLLEMIWGTSVVRSSLHRAAVVDTLHKAAPPPPQLPQQAFSARASLTLATTTYTTALANKAMSVSIIADSAKQPVDGITAELTFDPNLVSVARVDNGTLFATYIPIKIDNQKGRVRITAITDTSSFFTSSGIFATIIFTPKARGNTKIDFVNASNGSASAVAAKGKNILGSTKGLTIKLQ